MKKKIRRLLILAIVVVLVLLGGKEIGSRNSQRASEIIFPEADFGAGLFAYEQLSDTEKQIYYSLYEGAADRAVSIKMNVETTQEAVQKCYQFVLADHPELFWIDGSATYWTIDGKDIVTEMEPVYTVEENEIAFYQEQIDAQVDVIQSGISQDVSDYEKIRYVFEYLINNTEYDSTASHSQDILSVFVSHASVCAGYSKATQYILNKMGIFCTYITGQIKDSGISHAWNLVRMGEKYYYLDTTWGDPVFAGSQSGEGQVQQINYNYLCCTSQQLYRTHVPDAIFVLPDCVDGAYNYHKLNSRLYTSYDQSAISSVLQQDARSGKHVMEIAFVNEQDYLAAVNDVQNESLLHEVLQWYMTKNNADSWAYRYMLDDEFYVIKMDFQN
jgi:hypothetical protein